MSNPELRILLKKVELTQAEKNEAFFGTPISNQPEKSYRTVPVLQVRKQVYRESAVELHGLEHGYEWVDVPIIEDNSSVVIPTLNTDQTTTKPVKNGYWIVENIDRRSGNPTGWYLSIVPNTYSQVALSPTTTHSENKDTALKFYDEKQANLAANLQRSTMIDFWQAKYYPHTQDLT